MIEDEMLEDASSQNGVAFTDIAAEDNAGITYRRVESPHYANSLLLNQMPAITMDDLAALHPMNTHGLPGIAIWDYDNDGDRDLYVTNGPGASNSLYTNQLQETGEVTFIDRAEAAGVALTDFDSSATSYGDIDNDGDQDLLVLGAGDGTHLFENQGDGTFIDISETSGIGGGDFYSTSSSMGDVNGDGLLDIVVGNSFDWNNMTFPIVAFPFELNEPNQIFINQGNNTFVDASETSGIRDLVSTNGEATITWAISLVDYDLDGDLDLIQANDQGAYPGSELGGVDRGLISILQNDGTGSFTDVTSEANMTRISGWMGLTFGDFNSDGYLDLFATSAGDYAFVTPPAPPPGGGSSRWFLGQADGTFQDPGVGELVATPFGWGTSASDYDNDGDTDLFFTGGLHTGLIVDASNPGVVLENDGNANFTYNAEALGPDSHRRRNGAGLAVGDLNNDGFNDLVVSSNYTFPEPIPLEDHLVQYGSPFDEEAQFVSMYVPTDTPGEFRWSGAELQRGRLAIEINNADGGNNWVAIETLGTVGITEAGRTNRDGIGAVVSFTPEDGAIAMRPIVGGSSHASQDSLDANFGLGTAESGTVEVFWQGGVRNRLYDVQAGEQLLFPEIPVSFDGEFEGANDYQIQVSDAIDELVVADVLTETAGDRFFASGIRAFAETHDITATLMMGSAASETMRGSEEDEHLYGRSGDDVMAGDMGDDTLFGGDGDDVLRGDRNQRKAGGSVGGDDVIYGGEGNDYIGGKAGDDTLYGEDGDDHIWGDHGNDILRGGLGNDTLTGDDASGGTGSDTFILAIGEGTDTITDFAIGEDVIGLAEGLSFGQLTITQENQSIRIGMGDETLAILTGVDTNEFMVAADTIFVAV